MENVTMWLAQQRAIEARRMANEARTARVARRASGRRSLLERVRGEH